MALLAKLASRRNPGPQVALVRFAVGVAATAVAWSAGKAVIRPRRWGWLAARGFFGGTAVMAYFACLQRVPVGVATLLNQTYPIYTLGFAWILIKERPSRAAFFALPLTLGGVVLIIGVRAGELHAAWGELLGVLSSIGSGVAVTSIRAARRDVGDGQPSETAWSVFFSFTALGTLVTLPTVLPPLGHWVAPTRHEWTLLLATGATSVVAQLILSESLEHVSGTTAGIISQLTVLFAVAGGAVFLGDRLTPSFLVGGALTLSGVALTVLSTSPRFVAWFRG